MADVLADARARAEETRLKAAGKTLDELKAQRNHVIGLHMKALEHEQAEDAQMLNLVVQKAIEHHGLPPHGSVLEFVGLCETLAETLNKGRRHREAEQMKTLFDGLNAREPNEVIVASAKRAGVELSVASEAAKLVAG